MIKRILLVAVLGVAGSVVAAEKSDAGIIFRGGPVRRVAARAVLPPYPVARTVLPPYPVARAVLPPNPVARSVVAGPVYGPVYGAPVVYGTPVAYGSPYVYGGGVSVVVGF
jgi:hypothetical protein